MKSSGHTYADLLHLQRIYFSFQWILDLYFLLLDVANIYIEPDCAITICFTLNRKSYVNVLADDLSLYWYPAICVSRRHVLIHVEIDGTWLVWSWHFILLCPIHLFPSARLGFYSRLEASLIDLSYIIPLPAKSMTWRSSTSCFPGVHKNNENWGKLHKWFWGVELQFYRVFCSIDNMPQWSIV